MNNDFTKTEKDQIWNNYFPNSNQGTDVFGYLITKNDCDFDHIYPKYLSGGGCVPNGIPMSGYANGKKTNDLKGVINGKTFKVENSRKVCISDKGTVGILYVNNIKVSK